MSNLKIKRGDQVVVIAGAFKGTIGIVTKVDTKTSKVYVSNVATIIKYKKKNTQIGRNAGSMINVSRPIHISNVMYYETDKGASRLSYKVENGTKVRISKKSGTILSSPSKNIIKSTELSSNDISNK